MPLLLRFILLVLIVALARPGAGMAQEAASFSVDVVSTRSSDDNRSRLDIYAAIPFAHLQFLKASTGFSASYDVYVEVFALDERNSVRELVQNPSWEAAAAADNFAATQSAQNAALTTQSIFLDPGRYMVRIEVQDRASALQMQQELIAEVRHYTAAVAVSDLILVQDFDEATQTIVPLVSDRVTTREASFKFFYEAYAQAPAVLNVERVVIRTQKSKSLPFLRWLLRRWRDDESTGDIAYQFEGSVRLQKGRNPVVVTVPLEGYEVGEYVLRVALRDAEGREIDAAERAISLVDREEAQHQGRDIDEAIAQLAYVAKPRELRHIREGTTKQERLERFLAFWEKRDPTPATPTVNERMEEYYHRIDFANRHYSGPVRGWESDRGHALVLFGEPDEVELGEANADVRQPYEIWHYRRIGRRFVFIDDTGRGDFRMVSPPWDERATIR